MPLNSQLIPHSAFISCCTPLLFVFRHNRKRPEAFQEPASAPSVLFVCQEMQRGAEESAGPADSVRHHKT